MQVQVNLIPSVSTHVSSWFLPFTIQVTNSTCYSQVVFSWENDESNRVIGVSPGNRNIS